MAAFLSPSDHCSALQLCWQCTLLPFPRLPLFSIALFQLPQALQCCLLAAGAAHRSEQHPGAVCCPLAAFTSASPAAFISWAAASEVTALRFGSLGRLKEIAVIPGKRNRIWDSCPFPCLAPVRVK